MSIERLLPPWIASLVPYEPGKPVEEVEREYGVTGAVKLASNENPLGPSPKAVEALRKAATEVHRYPDGGGYYLRRKLAERYSVPVDEVLLANGSNEVLEMIARVLLRPGDDAVMSAHAFVVYSSVVQAAAGVARAVPMRDGTHDLEAMADAIGGSTRIVFLGNPNNPTGTIYRREAFERFLARVGRDVVVVADEAYFDYVEDPDYPDSLRYRAPGRPLVTVRTFSKIHGLAGLRIGYAIAPAELVSALNRIREPFNVNSLAQVAGLAALDDTDHVERSRRANAEGKRLLLEGFRELGLTSLPSEANFLLVEVGDGCAVTEALLRRGVIVRPMGGYGFSNHVRVTIGTAEENRRFLAALGAELGGRAGGDHGSL